MAAPGSRFRKDPETPHPLSRPAAEMNLTPLIDVLLVLLVIFMAAVCLTQRWWTSQRVPASPALRS